MPLDQAAMLLMLTADENSLGLLQMAQLMIVRNQTWCGILKALRAWYLPAPGCCPTARLVVLSCRVVPACISKNTRQGLLAAFVIKMKNKRHHRIIDMLKTYN
jgi:hypothetical protein